jgi:hypothetical protein
LFYKKRLKQRLNSYSFNSRDLANVMTVNCGDAEYCADTQCLKLIFLYSGFYSRLYRGESEQDKTPQDPLTMHGINLSEYRDFKHYQRELGKRSSFFLRHTKRAIKSGCIVMPFNPANYSIDMVSIHRSMKIRSFGVMLNAWFANVKDFGGVPTHHQPTPQSTCYAHWEKFIGVFADYPGYSQGGITTDKQLVGYARLHRIGNMLAYKDYLGDGRYLNNGVMKLLHLEIMRWVMDANNPDVKGIENIAHGSIERGNNGLFFWKKKALFAPYKINMVEPDLPLDFNPAIYLALNPDVRDSRLGPALHYKVHGRYENRTYK